MKEGVKKVRIMVELDALFTEVSVSDGRTFQNSPFSVLHIITMTLVIYVCISHKYFFYSTVHVFSHYQSTCLLTLVYTGICEHHGCVSPQGQYPVGRVIPYGVCLSSQPCLKLRKSGKCFRRLDNLTCQ